MARHPFFTFINILGLGVGFASFFALWNFATNELQTDQYHKNSDRIARISWDWRFTDDSLNWKSAQVGFSKSDIPVRAKEDLPEIEDFTRIHVQLFFGSDNIVPHGDKILIAPLGTGEEKIFKEDHVVYADQNLFEFFTIPLIQGNAKTVLKEAGSVVLSESLAAKYFGKADPVGKLLKLNDSLTLKVTGVFQNLPRNTHLVFDMVISNVAYVDKWAKAFNAPTLNHVRLAPGVSFSAFQAKLNAKRGDYCAALRQRIANTDPAFFVQPLTEIVFGQKFFGDQFSSRSRSLLITFAVLAFVILAMAWINYINLWIARNKRREKELAARKIHGARSRDLLSQFLTESAFVNILSILAASTILQLTRNLSAELFQIYVPDLSQLTNSSIVIFAGVVVLSMLVTGLCPMLVARKNSVADLFRKNRSRGNEGFFSSSLAVVQYASGITLILWASVVYFELAHVLNIDVGLDRDNVIIVEVPSAPNKEASLDFLTQRLTNNAAISGAAYSILAPGASMGTINTRKSGTTMQVGFEPNGVDERYMPLLGLKLLAGRNFRPGDADDVGILSEVAAHRHGFTNPADAVGTRLELLVSEGTGGWKTIEIIGIMKDFRSVPCLAGSDGGNFDNKYQSQGKILFYKNRILKDFDLDRLAIKTTGGNWTESINSIESTYSEVFPNTPFTWTFLEDSMNNVYDNEAITRNQIALFVVLAIIIACLGFQGMIADKIISTTREVGIRKVLGASLAQISRIILGGSSIHFGLSLMIGIPLGAYLGHQYLKKFSEQIELQWWHYLLPAILLAFIMAATVSAVLWKAAHRNPVEALKHE